MINTNRLNLTQPEIIQLLRRRSDMNQGTFGSKAFNTSFESGRTKIKNIELGRQVPTQDDLHKMAGVLGISVTDLIPGQSGTPLSEQDNDQGVFVSAKVLERFPELGPYLEMLNKSVMLDDNELVGYITDKITTLLSPVAGRKAASGQG